ncbi:hypothetical protein F444_12023 [Phytophthora nicotianae P1976]|uniref:Uncharacterized protein n=1 Tax=Phytophthora nicotianae P1976 TaxID=1317066 RepID=A0A080ZYF3_PHYNI|nr:hypothetical protein F444_12023 [Phytophthora nicotianae P1976]
MSEKQAAQVFRSGMDSLKLAPSTRKRRVDELSATTIVRLVREAQTIVATN